MPANVGLVAAVSGYALGAGCILGDQSFVRERTTIGAGTVIGAGAVIGADVRIGRDSLIGAAGQSLGIIERAVDRGMAALCAEALGIVAALNEATLDYLKARKQFGVPIGSFQALKHQLANMALDVEPGRGLFWYAAHAFDKLPERAAHAADGRPGGS